MRAGFASTDITPAGRCDLNGFIGRTQPATGVGGRLRGRVLALATGQQRALVVVCDLLGLSMADSGRVEAELAAAAGCSAKSVLVACTHTHSGPMSMKLGAVGHYSPRYIRWATERLREAAARAAEQMAPVSGARFGRASAEGLGQFRCATHEPGRDVWPGRVSALRIEREGAPAVVIVHAGIHPHVLGGQNRLVHPDYPGDACYALEEMTGAEAIFLPGCGADVQPDPSMVGDLALVRDHGRRMATRALAALDAGAAVDLTSCKCATLAPRVRFGFIPDEEPGEADADEQANAAMTPSLQRVANYMRHWRGGLKTGKWPDALALRSHVMTLGPIVLVGLPAEVFWDTGAEIDAAVEGADVLTVSQCGGDVGYLPRPFAYRNLTYEVVGSFQWYRTAGAALDGEEASVRQAVVAAVKKLRAPK